MRFALYMTLCLTHSLQCAHHTLTPLSLTCTTEKYNNNSSTKITQISKPSTNRPVTKTRRLQYVLYMCTCSRKLKWCWKSFSTSTSITVKYIPNCIYTMRTWVPSHYENVWCRFFLDFNLIQIHFSTSESIETRYYCTHSLTGYKKDNK